VPDLATLADEYLEHVAATRSLHTADIRRTALTRRFVPWAVVHDVTELEDITSAVLDRFSRHLQTMLTSRGRPLSKVSVHTYCRELNLFLGWAAKHAGGDPALRAQAPPLRQREMEVLSRAEIDQLEAGAAWPRDALMIRLLADTGIRSGELLGLRPRDVIRQDGQCFIRVGGKTGQRTVVIEAKMYRRIRAYVEGGRGIGLGEDDPLFVTLRAARDGCRRPLTKKGVESVVRYAGARAGIEKDGRGVYPHLLRHSFATEMLNRGMDPLTLRRIMGWTSLAMMDRVYFNQAARDRHEKMLRVLQGKG